MSVSTLQHPTGEPIRTGLITKLSIGQIQRWCAQHNAQLIFNCDGTIYAATPDDIEHHQVHGDSFALALGSLA